MNLKMNARLCAAAALTMLPISALGGSHTLVSGRCVVDTRYMCGPVIQDVTCKYGGKNKHVYFLNGVALNVAFTANVNWNGRTPQAIVFSTPNGTYNGSTATRTFNVGSEFSTGEKKLKVTARATDGTESAPFTANFDFIPPPPPITAAMLSPVFGDSLKYTMPYSMNWDFFDAVGTPTDDIPGFGGKALGFLSSVDVSCEVNGDGTAEGGIYYVANGVSKIVKVKTKSSKTKVKLAGIELGPEIAVVPNWTYINNQWKLGGTVGLGLNLSVTIPPPPTPPPYIWATPPIYMRGEVSAQVDATLGITGWSEDGKPIMNGVVGLEADGTFVLGCGWAYVAAIEGSIGGGPTINLEFPNEPMMCDLGVNLHGEISVVFLVFRADLIQYEKSWWLVGGEQAKGMMFSEADAQQQIVDVLKNPEGAHFTQLSRDYLSRKNKKGGIGILGMTITGSGVLSEDTFPYSASCLSDNSGKRMIVWLDDNSGRIDENRTMLVSQAWDGTNWTSKAPVWDNGTADFGPVLGVMPDGSAVAAWQKESEALTNGAPLEEALAKSEIAVGSYDPVAGTWTATTVTANAVLDHSPRLATTTNGDALLVWTRNESNSPFGSAVAPNSICWMQRTNGVWTEVAFISTNAGAITWTSLARTSSQAVFVASVDLGDEAGMSTNEELFASVFDGSNWSALVQLTTNDVQDSNPQVVFDSAGRLMLFWYRASNIVMCADSLDLTGPQVVADMGSSAMAIDYKLVTGPDGQITLLWEDPCGPDPRMINYDPALCQWSQPIAIMNTTNYLERSFSPAYTTNGSLVMSYNRVAFQIGESNLAEFGQTDLMWMEYLIGGDLGCMTGDLGMSPLAPLCGETATVSLLVRNLGECAASNVCVRFYCGAVTNSAQIGGDQFIGMLPAGSNVAASVAWVVPDTQTSLTLFAVVDPVFQQEDRNRGNNTAALVVLQPDLTIAETSVQRSLSNGYYVVNARVTNVGCLPATNAFNVVFTYESASGAVLATVVVPEIGVTNVRDASFEWDLSGAQWTNEQELVCATVDPNGMVGEADEDNNSTIIQVLKQSGDAAALTLVDITNVDAIADCDVTNCMASGTNNELVVGYMWVTNAACDGSAVSFAAATPWTAPAIDLVVGSNSILVYATNVAGIAANDCVAIYRAGMPFIDLTNAPSTVSYDQTNCVVAGTNNTHVVGGMWVTNATTDGVRQMFSATPDWITPTVGLNVGTNRILVYGSNMCGRITTDSVVIVRGPVGTGKPFLDVTNVPATVSYDMTNCVIAGTNNIHVVGGMRWTNSLTGGSGVLAATTNWTVSGISLAVGANVITVYGSNLWSQQTNDSVTITREGIGTGAPFVDVTNVSVTVSYDVTNCVIAGTNNIHVVGGMWVTNRITGGTRQNFAATLNWEAPSMSLAVGTNTFVVFGTNAWNVLTNDSVVIVRGPVGTGKPFLDVTNVPATVSYDMTNCVIAGTNNIHVVGGMRWTNSLTGGGGVLAATTNWTVSGISLAAGANVITVYGSNLWSQQTNDSVTITREGIGTGAPFVDVTNVSVTVSYDVTNCVIAGTNNIHVVGGMRWTNSLTGGGGVLAATTNWTVSGISLAVGANVITVYGSNLWSQQTNDSVTITRGGGTGSGLMAMQIAFTGYTNGLTLTNFPALIVLSNGTAGIFNYSQMLSPPNADLRFADANGTELNYEIDTWDATGQSYVWVQVPLLYNGAIITCFWGKAGADIPDYSTNGATWTEGYLSVHHLSAMNGMSALDSAVKGYDGTLVNMEQSNWVADKIGRSLLFNPANEGDEYVELPAGYSTFTGGVTVSAWVNLKTPVGYQDVISIGNEGYNDVVWVGANYGWNEVYVGDAVGNYAYMSVDNVYMSNQWVYVVFTCATGEPGTSVARIYKDGVTVDTATDFTAPSDNLRTHNHLGYDDWGDVLYGQLDEVQVSDVERSPEWVWASYDNQNDPATFAAYTPAEVSEPPSGPFVDITNEPATVSWTVTTYAVAGTNNIQVVGGMWVSNGGNSAVAEFTAQNSWVAPAIPLVVGQNEIWVFGTNAYGMLANDSVSIERAALPAEPTNVVYMMQTVPSAEMNKPVPFEARGWLNAVQVTIGYGTTVNGSGWTWEYAAMSNDVSHYCWTNQIVFSTTGVFYYAVEWVDFENYYYAWNEGGQTDQYELSTMGTNGYTITIVPPAEPTNVVSMGHAALAVLQNTVAGFETHAWSNGTAEIGYGVTADGSGWTWEEAGLSNAASPFFATNQFLMSTTGQFYYAARWNDGENTCYGWNEEGQTDAYTFAQAEYYVAVYGVPGVPTGVAASDGTSTDKVAVTWNAADNATKYAVWRNMSSSTNDAENISGDVTATNYDDRVAIPGTTYWYWVKAGNGGGWSGFSEGDSGYADYPVGMGTPFVDVTNAPALVANDVLTYAVAGTNNIQVAGGMWVSNGGNSAVAEFTAQNSWVAPAIPLVVGQNEIWVCGTNAWGVMTNDSVTISRMALEPVGDGVWISLTGGSWTNVANWQGGVIANGQDKLADISTLNITIYPTIALDRNRTIGHIKSRDIVPNRDWMIDAGTPAGILTLAVSGGMPTVTVVNRTLVINAEIAGNSGLCKKGGGILELCAANAYSGPTVVSNGTLLATHDDALAGSGELNITAGGTCDVMWITLEIRTNQALSGGGVLLGDVTVNGTSKPGDGIGALTIEGNATLGDLSTTIMELNRAVSTNCDSLAVGGTLTCGGTLRVTNLGVELQAGDSFNLLDGTISGAFARIDLPVLGTCKVWGTNNLYTTGVITVETVPGSEDVEGFGISRPPGIYGQTILSWNSNIITVLACTNRTYEVAPSSWFVLTNGVMSPWTHTGATHFASVYYRVVSGTYTSRYDVGKFDVEIAAGSIAWLSFPFSVQPGCDVVSDWFGPQLEARNYSGANYPVLQRQNGVGGQVDSHSYYVDNFDSLTTNWFPTNPVPTIVANAGYILFLPEDHPGVKLTGIGMVQTNNVFMQVPYASVPWAGLAFDVNLDMRASGVTNLFVPPANYSGFDYDYIMSQEPLGGSPWYTEYFIDDWGTGVTNFFPSQAGADRFEPGKGYLFFFSTTRTGTGTWTCVRPY